MDEWTKILDGGDFLDVAYMDFMKAFDTVPHKRLLGKISSFAILDPIHGWIKAFLSNRKQRVMVNGQPSSWPDVTSGVP